MPGGVIGEASMRILAVAAVAGLYVAIRRPGAATRHAVWTAVCAVMLALPLLLAVAPRWSVEYPAALLPAPQQVQPGVTVSVSSLRVLTPPAAPAPRTDWLVIAYAAGLGFFLLRLAAGWAGLRRLLRAARPLRELDAWESDRLHVPVTVGSRVLLPSNWRAWEPWQLQAVLAHERAHVQRRDWLLAQLAFLNRAVFWFHPLAWVLERAMAHAAEDACDDAARVHAPDASAYAALLVHFASARPAGARVAVAMARPSGLSKRVERLLLTAGEVPSRASRAAVAAICLLAIPTAALTFAPRTVIAQQPQPGLTPGLPDIKVIEDRIARNADDLEARGLKVVYLRDKGRLSEATDEIVWIIEHHPAQQYATIMSLSALGPFDARRIDEAWEKAVRQSPSDGGVLLNAAAYWRTRDTARSEDLIRRALAAAPGDERPGQHLASLYAYIAYGGPGTDAASVSRVRRELDSTNDANLVGEVGRMLARIRVVGSQNPDFQSAGLTPLAEKYLARARQLDPGNPRWSEQSLPPPPPPPPPADAPAYTGRLLRAPEPEYPALALQARIQGTVKFRAVIGADGSVTGLQLMSGHPLLVAAAQAAARGYKYEPAASGVAPIDIHFQLGTTPLAAASAPDPAAAAYTGNVIFKVEPEYPALALQARIQGTVRLQAMIGADGTVARIKAISGHPLLVQAAMDAVRQYRYQPAPPGVVDIEIPFRLPI